MIITLDYDNDETCAKSAVEKLIADFRAGTTLHFAVFSPEADEPEIISIGISDVIKFVSKFDKV